MSLLLGCHDLDAGLGRALLKGLQGLCLYECEFYIVPVADQLFGRHHNEGLLCVSRSALAFGCKTRLQ